MCYLILEKGTISDDFEIEGAEKHVGKEFVYATTLLCDVDGSIINSRDLHFQAYKQAIENDQEAFNFFLRHLRELKSEGMEFECYDSLTEEHYDRLASGLQRLDGVRGFLGNTASEEIVRRVANRKGQIVKDCIQKGEVKAYPKVAKTLKKLHKNGIRLVFVSSSSSAAVSLLNAGLLHLFEGGVLTGTGTLNYKNVWLDMSKLLKDNQGRVTEIPEAAFEQCADFPGKPDPFPFQEAARRAGIECKQCLVYEDAPAIVLNQSHKYNEFFAGVVGINTGKPFDPKKVADCGATLVVKTPAQFRSVMLTALEKGREYEANAEKVRFNSKDYQAPWHASSAFFGGRKPSVVMNTGNLVSRNSL